MKVSLARTLTGWMPADDEALRVSRRWSAGETAVVDLKKPRNYTSLKRYWKLCEVVFNNSRDFKSKDQVHQFLKIKSGHATQIVAKSTGEVYLLADSIDYDTIEDEAEFQEIWRRVVDVVCTDILPNVDRAELEHEVLKLCGLAGGLRCGAMDEWRPVVGYEERVVTGCEWEADEDGVWQTGCGQAYVLIEGGPIENSMKFCCYCGLCLDELPYE